MASLAELRTAVAETLAAALGAGTEVYPKVPPSPVLPCVCVRPAISNFLVAMSRGVDTYEFDLLVLAPSADGLVGQERLDPYVTGAGSLSIRQAIFNARGLGRTDSDAHVAGMTDYGGAVEAVGVAHVAAALRLVVHTTGTG